MIRNSLGGQLSASVSHRTFKVCIILNFELRSMLMMFLDVYSHVVPLWMILICIATATRLLGNLRAASWPVVSCTMILSCLTLVIKSVLMELKLIYLFLLFFFAVSMSYQCASCREWFKSEVQLTTHERHRCPNRGTSFAEALATKKRKEDERAARLQVEVGAGSQSDVHRKGKQNKKDRVKDVVGNIAETGHSVRSFLRGQNCAY